MADPSIKKEGPSIKQEEPSIKEEEPSIKQEEPSIKEEPSIPQAQPSIKHEQPYINREQAYMKPEQPFIINNEDFNDSSPIERLPLEILSAIFIESSNCNLPLASRTLLDNLSDRPYLQEEIAIAMLESEDPDQQTDLLNRRFLDLRIFDSVTREITEPCSLTQHDECTNGYEGSGPRDAPHFVFAEGVVIPARLLRNLAVEEHHNAVPVDPEIRDSLAPCNVCNDPEKQTMAGRDESATPSMRFWKVEMLRRLFAGGVDKHQVDTSVQLCLAAQQGLHDAVMAGNMDGIYFFLGWDPIELVAHEVLVYPRYDTLLAGLYNVNSPHWAKIVFALFVCVEESRINVAPEIMMWITRRNLIEARLKRMTIEQLRLQRGLDRQSAEGRFWTGKWVEHLWRRTLDGQDLGRLIPYHLMDPPARPAMV